MPTIGAVTIGQSPRADVVPELRSVLGESISILEAGALDRFTAETLEAAPGRLEGALLVTRLRDAREVHVGEAFVHPLVQASITALDQSVDLVVVLCTGSFPLLRARVPLLYPERVLTGIVRATGASHVGVLTPSAAQIAPQRERWGRVVPRVSVRGASPYGPIEVVREAAAALDAAAPDLLVLDCIGYSRAMRDEVRRVTRRPVLLASTCLARVAAELVG